MRVGISSILLIIIALAYGEHDDEPAKTHVAIVGAGIAGISTAYWLKYYLNDSIAITIYESDQIGGRLRTADINGEEYEAGGSIIHEKNLYMKRFAKELNLKQLDAENSLSYLMTKDGSQVLFSTLSNYIPSIILTLWRYGFDAIRLKFWMSTKLSHFLRIYDYQDNGRTFETVEEFLKLLDEDFYTATRLSFRKYLMQKGFNKRFIDELGQISALVNYDQSVDGMNAFPGLVSLMAAGSTLWHVKGGNYQVPKQMLAELLKQPDVQYVNGHVKSVEKVHRTDINDQGGDVRLAYQPKNSQLVHSVDYDYIVLAFPLHRDNTQDFHITANSDFRQHDFQMQSTYANFLTGKLNCSTYSLTDKECERLNAIFYTNPTLPYRSVAQQSVVTSKVKRSEKTDRSVFKVFSPGELTLLDYEKIFDQNHYKLVKEVPWLAYPKYEHPQKLPPIQLLENVFYANAMEWSASCMEIQAISARNVAMLLTKRLGKQLKRTDHHVEF